MRSSIALALAILALGAAPGFFQQKRLGDLRRDHARLAAEASKLGIATASQDPANGPRITKRQREDMEKQTRSTSGEILAFARELDAARKNGEPRDAAFQQRALEVLSKLSDLDPSQIRSFMNALRDAPDISDETRGSLIAFAVMTLSEQHPQEAVAIYAQSPELMAKNALGDYIMTSALQNWARTQPDQAAAWVRDNAANLKGVDADDLKRGVIAGAALQDPKKAFQLMGELGFEHPESAISAIVSTSHDHPEQRDGVLAGLRGYLSGIQDATEREEIGAKAMETFARTADRQGFETLTDWMEEAEFSPKEKEQFAGGLSWFTTRDDTGRWVEWLGSNLSAEAMPDPVREIVGEWTQQDYVAAGKWLGGTPDGPAKTAAIEAYAGAVAEYEPQVAVQWALTLPPGTGREATLRAIYQNWPPGDPQGAAAFAREHGLE